VAAAAEGRADARQGLLKAYLRSRVSGKSGYLAACARADYKYYTTLGGDGGGGGGGGGGDGGDDDDGPSEGRCTGEGAVMIDNNRNRVNVQSWAARVGQ
jgi:hypothetical protein